MTKTKICNRIALLIFDEDKKDIFFFLGHVISFEGPRLTVQNIIVVMSL